MSAIAPAAAVRQISDLPHPPTLPLLGNLHMVRSGSFHRVLEEWADRLGTPYLFRLGARSLVVWHDSELFQQVMRERPHRWRRSSRIEPVFREMGANGLFSVEGAAWEPQRRLIVAALAATHFRAFFPTIQAITERLRRRWEDAARRGEALEMVEELKRYTVDVTSALAFGEDPNTIEHGTARIQDHLALVFPAIMRRVLAPMSYWHVLKLPQDRRLDAALAEVHRYVAERIDHARQRMRDEPTDSPRNLLEAMIRLAEAPDSGFTEEDLSANVLTLLLGGEDTTAHMMSWTMPFLCADMGLQDRLHQEAAERFGDARVCPEFEQVRSLDRFEAIATEAARFKPTIPVLMFEATEPVVLDGVALAPGDRAVLLQRLLMGKGIHFHDPQTYDPERWLRPREEHTGPHDPRAFLQFGAGARVCPGRHLAGVEIRLVLSMLMRNFTARLECPPEAIEEILAFTMVPSTMPVRLTPRDPARQ